MSWYVEDRIKEILLKLVSIPSISETEGEVVIEEEIYDLLNQITYFQQHPEYLNRHAIENDKYGRCVISAFVRGQGDSTVIVFGHHDIVDFDGY